MANIGNLDVTIRAKIGSFAKGMNKVISISRITRGSLIALSGVAATTGAAFLALAKKGETTVLSISRLSQKAGVSPENLSKLGYAAEQSGSDIEKMGDTLFEFKKRVGEAVRDGTGPLNETFRQLGLSSTELNAMDPGDAFIQVADAIQKMPDSTRFNIDEIFGGDADTLVPLILKGSDGIRALTKEAEQLGLVVTGKSAASMQMMAESTNRVWASIDGLSRQIISALSPTITVLVNNLSDFIKEGMKTGLIVEVMDYVTGSIGYVVDALNIAKASWYILSAGINSGAAYMLEAIGGIANAIDYTFNTVVSEAGVLWNTLIEGMIIGVEQVARGLYAVGGVSDKVFVDIKRAKQGLNESTANYVRMGVGTSLTKDNSFFGIADKLRETSKGQYMEAGKAFSSGIEREASRGLKEGVKEVLKEASSIAAAANSNNNFNKRESLSLDKDRETKIGKGGVIDLARQSLFGGKISSDKKIEDNTKRSADLLEEIKDNLSMGTAARFGV